MSARHQLVRVGEKLNFAFDWSTLYLPDGVSISSRQWSVSPALAVFSGDTNATVHCEGFLAGRVYELQEAVVLSNGETAVKGVTLRCEA